MLRSKEPSEQRWGRFLRLEVRAFRVSARGAFRRLFAPVRSAFDEESHPTLWADHLGRVPDVPSLQDTKMLKLVLTAHGAL